MSRDQTVPVQIDDDAFAASGDCEPLGISADWLIDHLPALVTDATLMCQIDPELRPRGYAPVEVSHGALLRYPVADRGSLIFLLHKPGDTAELVAIWPQLNGGSSLIASVIGLTKSAAGTQAHAQLALSDLPDHQLCAYLSEYACGAGLWERGEKFDFRIIGLPLDLGFASVDPVLVGPDAPSYTSMLAAGMKPGPDGCFAFEQKGMAAFFMREDLAPNACEFRGTVAGIRDGGSFFGNRYRIADLIVFRSDDGEIEHALSIAISDANWKEDRFPQPGDDLQGIALLQAAAVGSIR